jgi:hypothetical protein
MKRVLIGVAEFFFFLLLDVIGGVFYHPFNVETKLAPTLLATRSFVWDGMLLMLAVWLLLLLMSVIRRRLASSALHSTIALALAALVGFFLKVGFITHNW